MSIPAYVYGFDTKDYHTETAATKIVEYINGIDGERLALIDISFTAGANAQTGSFLFAKDYAVAGSSRNTCNGGAVSGQKDIICAVAPKDPAGNAAAASDIIAFQLTDGTWEWDTVASLAASTITCTNNITGVDAGAGGAAIADGGKVLILGVVGDGAYLRLSFPASVTTTHGDGDVVLVHPYVGEPWQFEADNATSAGFLLNMVCAYINK